MQAKALNIDMSGKAAAEPDAPVYAPTAAQAGQGLGVRPSSSGMGHPFQPAQGAAAAPWGAQQQWQQQQERQGRQYGAAAGAAGAAGGGGGRHPFELDPRDAPHMQQAQQWQQQQQQQRQQQQQQQQPAAVPRAKQDHMGDVLRDNSRGAVMSDMQKGRLQVQDLPTAGARPPRYVTDTSCAAM